MQTAKAAGASVGGAIGAPVAPYIADIVLYVAELNWGDFPDKIDTAVAVVVSAVVGAGLAWLGAYLAPPNSNPDP